jgi:CRISPR type III-A-associated RAMP protein Csm4
MNPGLVVKLRPAGPWRIGPDSGARNRVDVIYHSDSLYSAVTSAMARMGSLEEWLNATVRSAVPAVRFSSCFPFLDEIGFVVPPRTVWPPTSPALMSARVRWKSARFVPLGIVQAILAGRTLDDSHWNVDGPSECLVPAGRHGPFRTGLRFSAAVDRLTGSSDRHSTACIEFRPGAGLWTVVAFDDESARVRWLDPVRAAFRLLADSGFGGERSRGWGRSEAPEFIEGTLPDMILGGLEMPAPVETADVSDEVSGAEPRVALVPETAVEPPTADSETPAEAVDATPATEPEAELPDPEPQAPDPILGPEDVLPDPETEPVSGPELVAEPLIVPEEPVPAGPGAHHWLLSLFTPASSDAVDWKRGNYTVLSRSGRVDSPAGSGELKKQLHMISEGSVLYAESAPCGSAPDVAPEGFAHPVFRAGFALSIPLPEVS